MTETVMGCRLKLVGTRGLYKDGPCVYLSNHRAWADFFIDMYLTRARFILSRFASLRVPRFAARHVGRSRFAFKRASRPHDALNNARRHLNVHRLYRLVSPRERGTSPNPPLKRGLIKYTTPGDGRANHHRGTRSTC